MKPCEVKLYALSTCSHCRNTKQLLEQCRVEYDCVDIDTLAPEERRPYLEEIRKVNPECTFPTLVAGDKVIIGFKKEAIKEALGIPNVEQLYEFLKKTQEPQGYFFNKDKSRVFDLLEGLLTNKSRYGYMCCPCRLAAPDPDWDKDIICPCVHRGPDVAEYGSCYCNLYVSREWNDEEIPHVYVPERRSLEKRFRF